MFRLRGSVLAPLGTVLLAAVLAMRPFSQSVGRDTTLAGEFAFCPSQPLLAVAPLKGPITIYRRVGADWRRSFGIEAAYPYDLTWSFDGTSLAWMEMGGRAAVWRNGKVFSFAGSNPSNSSDDAFTIALSPDGKRFAIGRNGETVEAKVGQGSGRSYSMTGSGEITVAYSRGGDLLAGGRQLLIAPATKGSHLRRIPYPKYIAAMAPCPDGKQVAILEFRSALEIQSLAPSLIRRTVWRGMGYPNDVAWSPDGKFVAIVLGSNPKSREPETYNRVVVLAVAGWHVAATLPIPDATGSCAHFDSSSTTLGITSSGPQHQVHPTFWSTSTWRTVRLEQPR